MIKSVIILVALIGLYGITEIKSQETDCLQKSKNPNGPVPPPKRSELYKGEQAFGMQLLQVINKATPNENIFFSPYSTYNALLLAYFGSHGETQKELEKVLRLDWAKDKSDVAAAYRIEKATRARRTKEMPLEFESADKIYFAQQIHLASCLSTIFNEELKSWDFVTAAEQGRGEINNWVANLTRNEIKEILSAGDISAETQLVLVNAAYLKAKWASQFDPAETKNEIFHTSATTRTLVPMMHKKGTYNLAIDERLGAYVLEMPYQTSKNEKDRSEISMLIILPPVMNFEQVLGNLTSANIHQSLQESVDREIDIWLPKFEFEQRLELLPILRAMGVNSLFDATADLSEFTADTKLNFGDAKHVSKIKVDEEGSTAASATVLFSFRSARPVEPTEFRCDHPFIFLIYDHKAKAILFTGVYRDPKAQAA